MKELSSEELQELINLDSIIKIGSNSFNINNKFDKPVILDFFAPWCNPCKMQQQILEELNFENLNCFKFNIENDSISISSKLYIRSIPSILFIKENVGTIVSGLHSKEKIDKLIKELL